MKIVYFHRNRYSNFSIQKVTQTVIRGIDDKEEFYMPCYGTSPIALLRNLWFVWHHRDRNSINHVTGDVHYVMLALIGCKSVLTVHDTVSLDFRKHSKWGKAIIQMLWYKLPLMIATKIVCISEATRESLKRLTYRDDIIVIHNAIDPIFNFSPMRKYQSPTRILFIGTNENKNLLRCFDALKGLDCELTIIGRLNNAQKRSLLNNKLKYLNKFKLTDEQILEEYKACDIVSFVSLFEGFGMIIIEANKVGRPVICSDIPVLKEVAGKSALMVDPNNTDSIRNGYISLLSDKVLCDSLIAKGEENVKRFNVDLIRQQWINLYKQF